MKTKKTLRTLVILLILSSNVGCDQVTKNIVRAQIDQYEQISLLNDYVTLMRVENSGAFLSLGHTLPQPIKVILLTILPIVLLVLCFLYVVTKNNLSTLNILGICFIIGGGAGNIYDRAVTGSVTDFIHIDFGILQTGIFNMADVSVMTGMLFVLTEAYLTRNKLDNETVNGQ